MSFRNPSVGIVPLRDAATALVGTDIDADDYTEWIDASDAEYIGAAIAVGTVTGTSPTLDVKFECRFNEASDVFPLPQADGQTTQAQITQFTTSNENYMFYCKNPLPTLGQEGQVRLHLDVGGTSPVFPCTQAVVIKVARGGR